MHAKIEINFVIMKFTPVSGHTGDQSKKLKIKFILNCFTNVISD